MCCRVDPGVCDKSRIARSPAIATPNLAAGYSGILGECMKSAASARHNLYKKKKGKYPGKPEHMAALCKEEITVSTLGPGSQTLTFSQHLQENSLLLWH